MALPSENRLKSKTLISTVCKKGASLKTPFFRCAFLPMKGAQKRFQSVVVVSKKYDNRATERNTIRRKINGALQQKLSAYTKNNQKFPENIYVIFPYDSAKNATSRELTLAVDTMIQKTSTWNFLPQKKKFSGKRKY